MSISYFNCCLSGLFNGEMVLATFKFVCLLLLVHAIGARGWCARLIYNTRLHRVTYTGEVRCDENHEDVVEEEQCHQQSYNPSLEEGEPTKQVGNEGKAKYVLNDPGIRGMTLNKPPSDNSKTEEKCDEEERIWTILQDWQLVGWDPAM